MLAGLNTAHRLYNEGHVTESLWLFERLAAVGLEEAQSNAAYLLQHASGIEPNPSRALRLLTHAAEQGSVQALVEVGDAHYYGRGTRADHALAVAWYRRAADVSDAEALFNMGWAHHAGDGAARDLHLAKRYYDLARNAAREAYAPTALALLLLRVQMSVLPLLQELSASRELLLTAAVMAALIGARLLVTVRRRRAAAAAAAAAAEPENATDTAGDAADAQTEQAAPPRPVDDRPQAEQ